MPIGNTYPLSILLTAVDDATAVIKKVEGRINSFGKSATKIGKSLTAGVTVPLVGIGVAATKASVDFEKGMSNVGTLIDTNTESLEAMGNEVLEIAKRTPVELGELTGALFDLRSAGVSAEDQFKVLEGSAQLAVAGLGTTEQAAKLAAGAINAWGLEGEDADKVFDQIFKTTKNGITTIAGLEQGFGAVAATAAASGTPLDEYLASVSALTTTTLPASQAHTQLKAVFAGLTRDTKQTREVFGALGAKNLPDLIKKSGGFVNALRGISGELGGDQAKMLKLVGSTEALNAILGLTGEQAQKFDDALADQRSGINESQKAFAKQNKTTAAALQRTKNSVLAAGIAIGDVLAPHIQSLATWVAKAANWFGSLDEVTKGWIVTLGGVFAAVGPVLMIIGKVATAVKLSPLGVAITLLATAAGMIISEWEYFEQFFELLWKNVVAGFEWAWSKIKPKIDRIRDGVKVITNAHSGLVNLIVSDDENAPLRPRAGRLNAPAPATTTAPAGRADITMKFEGLPDYAQMRVESTDANVDVTSGIPTGPLL